jgi:hypothetical protein
VNPESTNFDPRRPSGQMEKSVLMDEPNEPIACLAHLMPNRRGKPAQNALMIRQITSGVKLRDGSRLRLQAVRGPGGWLSRRSWVMGFLETLTRDRMAAIDARISGTAPAPSGQRSESERRKAADTAMAEIAQLSH